MKVTDGSQEVMNKYGISVSVNNKYIYKGYRYDSLEDAVNYAKSEKPPLNPKLAQKPSRFQVTWAVITLVLAFGALLVMTSSAIPYYHCSH
ncbi:MAG: hypothetical protein ACE5HS_06095 [bacterium]